MRERKGTAGRLSGLADGVAAAVRRRQQGREPRVVLYGPDGRPAVLSSSAEARAEIVEAAEEMLELVAAEPRRAGAAAEDEEAGVEGPEEGLPPVLIEDAQVFPAPGDEDLERPGRGRGRRSRR